MSGDRQPIELPFKDAEIGENRYRAHVLPLDVWAELTEYIASTVGGTLADLLRGYQVGDVSAILDLDVGAAGDALAKLVGGMSARQLLAFVDFAGKSLSVDEGQGLRRLDTKAQRLWWPRHMAELAPAMALFLKAQYADFFGGIGAMLPERSSDADDLGESTSLDPSQSPST